LYSRILYMRILLSPDIGSGTLHGADLCPRILVELGLLPAPRPCILHTPCFGILSRLLLCPLRQPCLILFEQGIS
jgi:hypothetical protein